MYSWEQKENKGSSRKNVNTSMPALWVGGYHPAAAMGSQTMLVASMTGARSRNHAL
jgi:hypothetical protein